MTDCKKRAVIQKCNIFTNRKDRRFIHHDGADFSDLIHFQNEMFSQFISKKCRHNKVVLRSYIH